MSYATRLVRRDPEHVDHPIGLGWLLAIALCGGILLFTTVGLLLVWWVKKSRSPGPQMVYSFAAQNYGLPPSSSRLTKRRLLGSESFCKLSSRISSRFSFVGPHDEPPPLPTHESLPLPERRRTVSRGRKRSRSWVDEDDMHGPRMARSKRNARESWFGGDGRLGMAPTLPNVDAVPEEVEVQVGVTLQHPQPRWLPRSQTEPRMAPVSNPTMHHNGVPTGVVSAGPTRIAVPQPAHVRPSVTDSDLKGILRSTERRLSERKSQSSIKAPRSSAVNGSPTKTIRSQDSHSSHHTTSSGRSSGGLRVSGSPPKRGPSHTLSGNNSTSTVGSAANSLIAAATQELKLPGGCSSPSKARGARREQQQQQQQQDRRIVSTGGPDRARNTTVQSQSLQRHSPPRNNLQRQNTHIAMMMIPQMPPQMQFSHMQYPQVQHHSMPPPQQRPPQRNPEHRMSFDSDKSSSLSTLYSTNEPEEERPRQRQVDDPFVEKGGPRRWPSWQARQRPANVELQRRVKTLSSPLLTSFMAGEPSCPPPLRPLSAMSPPDMGYRGLMSPLILEPRPTEYETNAGANGLDYSQIPYLPQAPSEISFVSMSVDSDVTEVPANETARVDWIDSSDSASSSPSTPTGRTRFVEMSSSSSPYDEREIMSLLMATAPSQRALPLPPPTMTNPDGSIVTILSPAPRGGLMRQTSTASSTYTLESFIADHQAGALSASPSRRSIHGPRLSSTIAELRRMNSVLSTYSVASLASTVAGDGDSPTLPASLSSSGSGALAKSRSVRFSSANIGSKHYLNVGNTKSMVTSRYSTRGTRHRRSETCYYGKDFQGLGLRLSCILDEALDSDPQQQQRQTQSLNLGYNKPGVEIIEGISPKVLKQKFGPVEELIEAEEQLNLRRLSIESLGLYDKDGFLLSSPERDAKKKRIRA
ncbi:uncharacterized protein Triagg1_8020 [Trichoderma aggressivum f. europaeum]|uniref:Uncharacterized protein n=1 Tax=Trichoderma aggressivum f. europaeum TaxID=173218 RepID=A0AAE1IB96_9HYPO|nr:hypothetical protein Triagg1_8020 [Trichoderma aggressivum f. europaeum]